jgi:hypothetical protein
MAEETFDPYDEEPVQKVGNGPDEQRPKTKAENISALTQNPKTSKVLILTVASVGIVILLVILIFVSRKNTTVVPPELQGVSVGRSPQLTGTRLPGGQVESAGYEEMVDQVNKDRAKQAEQSGKSAIPLASSVERTLAPAKTPAELEKEAAENAMMTPPPVVSNAPSANPPIQQQIIAPMNQEQYNQMRQVAGEAVSSLLATRPRGTQSFEISVQKVSSPAQDSFQGGRSGQFALTNDPSVANLPSLTSQQQQNIAQNQNTQKTLIPAGMIYAARLDSAVNTDIGGDFVATMVTGPYAGARLIGSSKRASDSAASMQFRSMSLPNTGITIPIAAIALDAGTMEAATATSVDRKLFVKYGVKPLAAGLAAVGQAIGTAGQTTISSGGQTTTVTQPMDTETMRNVAIGAAAKQLISDADALNVTPTIRVSTGSVVGVMFTADVFYSPKPM